MFELYQIESLAFKTEFSTFQIKSWMIESRVKSNHNWNLLSTDTYKKSNLNMLLKIVVLHVVICSQAVLPM